ncbi:hypothetical protein ATZ33_11960 [Enterococcus silesiacus]|uniref:RDD domain-containing protein n=1 Tax=Enterococcus silesiacus TaxID=332949 RepID=A0ABM5WA24_9ENTE|nr:hypothetical protein ATZ33_11960 [Enterococcus silesiacus]
MGLEVIARMLAYTVLPVLLHEFIVNWLSIFIKRKRKFQIFFLLLAKFADKYGKIAVGKLLGTSIFGMDQAPRFYLFKGGLFLIKIFILCCIYIFLLPCS